MLGERSVAGGGGGVVAGPAGRAAGSALPLLQHRAAVARSAGAGEPGQHRSATTVFTYTVPSVSLPTDTTG